MLDILPPDFTGSFREQLYAIAQWLRQFNEVVSEELRKKEEQYRQYVAHRILKNKTELYKVNMTEATIDMDGGQYVVSDGARYVFDYPIQDHKDGFPGWFVQGRGDNRVSATALKTYAALDDSVSGMTKEQIYLLLSPYLPLPYKTMPFVFVDATGYGVTLVGVLDAEENLEVNNEGEEEPT